LSGLGWAARYPLRLLDTTAVLRADTQEAADGAGRLLAPFMTDEPDEPDDRDCYALVDGDHTGIDKRAGQLLAYRDENVVGGGETWANAFGAMMATLNRRVIDNYAGFALHAGVVATGGRAIAFPADSGGGKSTLTAACLQAGFDYVSDEALCIDAETGVVEAYPKPLGLSPWSRRRLGIDDDLLAFPAGTSEGMVTPADFGASVTADPIELAHVVIPTFGQGPPVLAEAPGHVAMATLIEFSFNHYKHQERAFTLAAQLANQVDVWRLEYDDPVLAAQLLKEQLA
jgi:hypothetical protein